VFSVPIDSNTRELTKSYSVEYHLGKQCLTVRSVFNEIGLLIENADELMYFSHYLSKIDGTINCFINDERKFTLLSTVCTVNSINISIFLQIGHHFPLSTRIDKND
jgi:hypothetical protein